MSTRTPADVGTKRQNDVPFGQGGQPGKDDHFDVVVVGAGIAGLAAAATAASGGVSVLLVDSRRPGGRAVTDQVGRFKFNRGGHALYRTGAGLKVLKRLGVQVAGALPPTKGGLGRLGDQVGRLPTGVSSFFRSPLFDRRSKRKLARVFVGMPLWRPERLAERTAADWLAELADDDDGALAYLEVLARLTTYAADFERISADLVAAQQRGGILGQVHYLHGGWATMVDGLERAAARRGVELGQGCAVRQVTPDGQGVRIELAERSIVARRVVLAVGTPEATSALLPDVPSGWSVLGPPARTACLDMGFPSAVELSVLLGVDRPHYLIRHSSPAKGLAPEGASMVHAMRYLRPDEDLSPDQARSEMEEHARAGGLEPNEAEEVRYLHRMVACGALPLPERGGLQGRPRVTDTGHERLLVAGDWVGPIGHLADASLASGEEAGRQAVQRLEREPHVAAVA